MKVSSGDIIVLFELITFVFSLLVFFFLFIFIKKFYLNKKPLSLSSRARAKTPLLSTLLSLFIPGGGQVYNGETRRGITYLLAFVLSAVAIVPFLLMLINSVIIAALPAIVLFIFILFSYFHGLKDASETSKLINQRLKVINALGKEGGDKRLKSAINLFATGNHKPALYAFTQIIEKDPTFPGAHYNRAVLYYKLGDYSKAKAGLVAAARLGHKTSKHVLETLKIDY